MRARLKTIIAISELMSCELRLRGRGSDSVVPTLHHLNTFETKLLDPRISIFF